MIIEIEDFQDFTLYLEEDLSKNERTLRGESPRFYTQYKIATEYLIGIRPSEQEMFLQQIARRMSEELLNSIVSHPVIARHIDEIVEERLRTQQFTHTENTEPKTGYTPPQYTLVDVSDSKKAIS